MKITFLSPRNDLTGNRKLITLLARELARMHAVSILYPVLPDREFHRLRKSPSMGLASVRRLLGYVRNHLRDPLWKYQALLDQNVEVRPYWHRLSERTIGEADAVVYFTPYQALELAGIGLCSPTIFYVMHDQSLTDAHLVDRSVLIATYRSAPHVIALSCCTKENLAKHGVRCEAVIPAGVDSSIFYPGKRPDGRHLKVLGYFVPGERRKDAGLLLEVLGTIRRRYPELAISVLADGAVPDEYQAYQGLTERELAALYRDHDIFVYPSLHEGFALPPLEAMASGCAVVTTRVGAAADYAADGSSALLCDPGEPDQIIEAIERLIRSPQLVSRLVKNAVQQVREWSWERAGARMEEYLNTVCIGDGIHRASAGSSCRANGFHG